MISHVKSAIDDFKNGNFVIITDDEDRENEGDLIIGAEFATKDKIAFMMLHARGLICIPMTQGRIDELGIPMMIDNPEDDCANFTVSVDAKKGGTGISAADRALTIKTLIDSNATLDDLIMPGHMFPLRSNKKGICQRRGHTEATIDLCKMAGMYPAGVLAEVLNDDGDPASKEELEHISRIHSIKIITMDQLKKYKDHINYKKQKKC